jgi:hypothetical protein
LGASLDLGAPHPFALGGFGYLDEIRRANRIPDAVQRSGVSVKFQITPTP